MTDYIRREDALRAVQRQRCANRSPAQNEMLNGIKTDIIRAPAADVAPVAHGAWVHSRHDNCSEQSDVVKCSRCGLEAYAMAYHVRDGNYCPRCGARMDGGNGNG